MFKALAKRLYISLGFCYTYVLQKSSDVLCCGQTVRHFTIQFIRFFNLESCLHKRFSPLQQQPVRQYKRAQVWYDKTGCNRSKIIVFEAVSERECLFHESERKVKAEKGCIKNDSTQVDTENAGGSIMRTGPGARP